MVFSCNRESKKVQTVWLELESFHHTELMIISILTSFNESFTYKKYNPVKDWCVFLSVTIFLTWCNFKFEPQTAALRNWNVFFFFSLQVLRLRQRQRSQLLQQQEPQWEQQIQLRMFLGGWKLYSRSFSVLYSKKKKNLFWQSHKWRLFAELGETFPFNSELDSLLTERRTVLDSWCYFLFFFNVKCNFYKIIIKKNKAWFPWISFSKPWIA